MNIKILDPNGHEVYEMRFPLLDIDINKGRHIITRSLANKNGLLCGTTLRRDAQGHHFIEVKMNPESQKRNISLFVKQIIKEYL